jgi:hypothetical protein
MLRLTLTLAAWMSFSSAVLASLAPRKESALFDRDAAPLLASKLSPRIFQQGAGQDSGSEFNLTERTEILLDGKPCKYEAVPGHATIVHMEVAADRKTVLKIHFRSGK